ncbi:hypothetical protein GGS23DRAFT_595795 [Durotheca rogersii]|uniref:uncharacterized protein n=1 Tax=Durotheca rogersii TaxID=419775 RepID=UPI002220D452|nr:uncharacterized protein GGS23DRAFT_595795 [Durotheca rogersii]KAI5864150.1 hypothetical protein GGS23DRAFT_595795 [Durotheca rogersii]
MCVEIWTISRDPDCHHKIYQNTFPCHVARRCDAGDDMLLDKPKFLPDRPTKLPPGMLGCTRRVATRPRDTKCPECAAEERRAKAAGGSTATASASVGSRHSSAQQTKSPSPSPSPSSNGKAAETIRRSLYLLDQQRAPSRTLSASPASGASDSPGEATTASS